MRRMLVTEGDLRSKSTDGETHDAPVEVDVEPLLALALVGVVPVVGGDLRVRAEVEALVLFRISRRLDHDFVAAAL